MIIVTGATGFVGKATCKALAEAALPFRPIGREPSAGQPGVGDIGPDTDWSEALQGATTVIHLAARVHHMQERTADPYPAYRRTNVEGTLALAKQAHSAGARRFIFVSTVKVLGECTELGRPFRIGDPTNPLDAYGRSKLEAEKVLVALSTETGLEVVVVRPPLVYGAGVRANFRSLVSLVQRGLPLPFGAIRNKRSLIAADNLADLLVLCTSHARAPGGTFLCSDGLDFSTPDLLRAVGRACGKPAKLIPIPVSVLLAIGRLTGQAAALRRVTESLQVDIAPTCDRLGWKPPLPPEDALAKAARSGWL